MEQNDTVISTIVCKSTTCMIIERDIKIVSPQSLCFIKIGKSTTQNAFFECKKCLRAGSFAAPLCTRMTATFWEPQNSH